MVGWAAAPPSTLVAFSATAETYLFAPSIMAWSWAAYWAGSAALPWVPVWALSRALIAPPPVPAFTTSVAFMPDPSWPGMAQITS